MKGLFIPEITTEMFRNGCLESIEALMAEGEIYDIDYPLKQEPCDDCVSRQAVLEGIDTYINKAQSTGTQDDFYSFAELVVKALPPVTPQPKTGYWISWYEIEEEWGNPHCKCSECSTEVDPHTSKFINCCPICGAKIIGYKKREET